MGDSIQGIGYDVTTGAAVERETRLKEMIISALREKLRQEPDRHIDSDTAVIEIGDTHNTATWKIQTKDQPAGFLVFLYQFLGYPLLEKIKDNVLRIED